MLADYINYITPVPATQAIFRKDAAQATNKADKAYYTALSTSPLIFPKTSDFAKLHRYPVLTDQPAHRRGTRCSSRSTSHERAIGPCPAGAVRAHPARLAVAGDLLRRADAVDAVGVDDDRRRPQRLHADLPLRHLRRRVEQLPHPDHPVAVVRPGRDRDLPGHRLSRRLLDRLPRRAVQVVAAVPAAAARSSSRSSSGRSRGSSCSTTTAWCSARCGPCTWTGCSSGCT